LPAIGQDEHLKCDLVFVEGRKVAVGVGECALYPGDRTNAGDSATHGTASWNYGLVEGVNRFHDFAMNHVTGMIDERALVERDAERRAAG
jgi:hypothetical protein